VVATKEEAVRRLAIVSAALLVLATDGSAMNRAGAAVRRTGISVYLVRGETVSPVRRTATGSAVALAAVRLLLQGPTAAERRAGYTSAIPAGTRLAGVGLSRGVLTVDLARRFERGGGSLSMQLRVAQVVFTATQFSSVRSVAFRLDGKRVAAIGGEGVDVAPAATRAKFEGQAPRILVERPLRGDRVASPLRIAGSANVFEAQFAVDVTTADGTLLAHRIVHAGSGDGRRGGFEIAVSLTTRSTHLVVLAYDRSAKDGKRVHEVRVPVAFAPRS